VTRRRGPVWLDKRAVLATHQMLLAEFGGSPGLRDEGLLDSALARPRNLRAYESADIVSLAASYAAGMVRNHPFVDGNKRTGFMAAYIFLERNGMEFVAPEAEATAVIRSLAAGEIAEAELAAWLRRYVRKAQPD
jgi:death-on-curing protein